jgi:hypothetical protein
MPRPRSAGVLAITLFVGIMFATVISRILDALIDHSSVVHRVLIDSYVYSFGPGSFSLIIIGVTFGLTVDINLMTILAIMAAYYYWKYRTY